MTHESLQGMKARHEIFRRRPLEARLADLRTLEQALRTSGPSLCRALEEDFGKSTEESTFTEIYPLLHEIKFARKNLKKWARSRQVPTPLPLVGTRSWIQPEPRGLVLILSPWNYPLNLSLGPLISAFAAGCTVVLKPSELTPRTSSALKTLLETHFPPDQLRVIEGGPEVASHLLDFPFDHVFFTGSPRVGRIVMEKAARNLTSVTLELGGKSPAIIDHSADLPLAARRIAWGKFVNSGQTCIAPDHVWVEKSVAAVFLDEFEAAWSKMAERPPGASRSRPQLISRAHAVRLNNLLDEAKNNGATVRHLEAPFVGDDPRDFRPALVLEGSQQTGLWREEIFGPLLPVRTFDRIEKALDEINRHPKPLAAYLFSRQPEVISMIRTHLSSGGLCINDALIHFGHSHLPFGGVGESGMGASHGLHGFRAFSHEKAILERRHSSWLARLFEPPYHDGFRRLLGWLLRFLP